MSDLISRQAAIVALEKNKSDWNNDYNKPIDKDIQTLSALPSAEPVHGECDHCVYKWDMRGESDEE